MFDENLGFVENGIYLIIEVAYGIIGQKFEKMVSVAPSEKSVEIKKYIWIKVGIHVFFFCNLRPEI